MYPSVMVGSVSTALGPSALLAFPTRRSSDLIAARRDRAGRRDVPGRARADGGRRHRRPPSARARSEEHTSELQSLAYFVCRLLLEKKKGGILLDGLLFHTQVPCFYLIYYSYT